jgi:hypothetical protein
MQNKKKLTKPNVAILVCGFLGLAVALFAPFKSFGDGIKLGLGDLINGGVAMGLLLVAGCIAVSQIGKTTKMETVGGVCSVRLQVIPKSHA